MRFRSELLQPPTYDSEAMLTRIYDVYRTSEKLLTFRFYRTSSAIKKGEQTAQDCEIAGFRNLAPWWGTSYDSRARNAFLRFRAGASPGVQFVDSQVVDCRSILGVRGRRILA